MKRVLIVSYDFPPSAIGIWRTLKFCRYMGEFGWEPSILTVKPVRSTRYDLSPLEELPADTPIRRTGSLDQNRVAMQLKELRDRFRGASAEEKASAPKKGQAEKKATHAAFRAAMDVLRRWVLVPDDRMGWYPFALREGRRWLREEKFDLIYSTCFPNTAHVVGEQLARESGLPFVPDYRDIWIGNYYFYQTPTIFHDRYQRRLEQKVVSTASQVISCTGPITEDFFDRYPDQPREKFHTITNGFDPGDFPKVTPYPDPEHFTISYVGTMYGSTSPEPFFQAVRQLLKRYPRWQDILRLRFVGTMIEPYEKMIDQFGLSKITQRDPYLQHEEALRVMAEADALLLIVAPVKGSHIMLTQKVFEYAAARRPVFGLVPKGAARDFLREIDEGPVVHPKNQDGIEKNLEKMLLDWEKNGRLSLQENPVLKKYERRELAKRMAGVLDLALE